MTKREIVTEAVRGNPVPYVPWNFGFTEEAGSSLAGRCGTPDIDSYVDNHFVGLGDGVGFFEPMGDERYRDIFGVVWNRSVDKDIGIVEGAVLDSPTVEGLKLPDPVDSRFFESIPRRLAACGDRYRVYSIGFSLFERAWTLRGMENLLVDFLDNPDFVRQLLRRIADYNIAQAEHAMTFDIDAVYFGDDWGQQHGLIMGPAIWREFLKPELTRMYQAVRARGRAVFIHSCGDVDELFDELIEMGVSCFNPFQPEVMDVMDLLPRYRGRLAFHGGLSTQQTLPYGSQEDVTAESERLLELGRAGSYIFSPAHAVEGDVPVENMLAFIEAAQSQPGYRRS